MWMIMNMGISINNKDKKWGIYIVATNLEDSCLFFNKMHTLYGVRPNVVPLCKKDSSIVINIILSRDSMIVLVMILSSELSNLKLLFEDSLLEDT